MEKDDKESTLIRMGVSGWKFLLVPAYPGCPGSKAVKRSLLLLLYRHTHTDNHLTALWPGLPRVSRCTYSYPWGRIRTDNKVHCVWAHLLYDALSQWGLLDPIKLAYNQSWPDGQLKLTASTFKWPRISMLTVLVCILYQLPPLSLATFWILWCRER